MIKRYGDPVRPGTRYTHRPGVYAILPRDGALLVTHQEATRSEFQLPGGGIDPGESPIAALHREIFEETGWRIAAPRRLGAFRRFAYMPEYDIWAEKLCTVYVARPVLRHAAPSEPGHTAYWMDPGLAARMLGNSGDRAMVARYLERS